LNWITFTNKMQPFVFTYFEVVLYTYVQLFLICRFQMFLLLNFDLHIWIKNRGTTIFLTEGLLQLSAFLQSTVMPAKPRQFRHCWSTVKHNNMKCIKKHIDKTISRVLQLNSKFQTDPLSLFHVKLVIFLC
jgi:hypothetical protein